MIAIKCGLLNLFHIAANVCIHQRENQNGIPDDSDGKESAYNAGELGLIDGLGRSPKGRHGNPLQYSCLENTMDRGAWWAKFHGVAKSWT